MLTTAKSAVGFSQVVQLSLGLQRNVKNALTGEVDVENHKLMQMPRL